jgi:alkylation response protein AidB-like acyl-CoA dehydrogenase
MSVASATPAKSTPQREQSLVERAKRAAPILSAQADAAEAKGALTDEEMNAFRSEGLLSVWIPKSLGGEETKPLVALEALEAICHADGSAGWVLMATQLATATAAAYLAPSAAKAMFSNRTPVVAGQGGPFGKALPEKGGYRLSGNWSYGSGTLHADYLHTGGLIYRDGKPEIRPGASAPDTKIFIVPVSDAKLLGNWDTLGLRATGSVDYTIESAHVPEDYVHDITANVPKQGGDLYRLGIPGFSAIGHTAFALGVARRALEELGAIGGESRLPTYIGGGSENFLLQYGNAEAKLRSLRAFAFEVWSDIEKTLDRGENPTVRQGTLIRLIVNYATSSAAEIASFAFRFSGGRATRNGPMQRCYRDMQTGAQHATASPPILAECSREMLGMAQGKKWGFRSLIPTG